MSGITAHIVLTLLFQSLTPGSTSEEVAPMTVVGWTGGSVILPCAPQKRDPNYSQQGSPCWYYQGRAVWNCGSLDKFSGRLSTSNTHNLHVSNLRTDDSGLYIYVQKNGLVWKVNLTVIEDSTIAAEDMQFVTGVRGHTVVLPCFASYPGKPFGKHGCWYHHDTDVLCWTSSASSNRFHTRLRLLANNNLELSQLSQSDAGAFTCQISSTQRGQVKLIVKDVSVSRPSIARSPDRDWVIQGAAVTYTCRSEHGSWPIAYHWWRLDRRTGSYASVGGPGGTLSFPSTEPADSGDYRCVASNLAFGKTCSQSADVRLSVQSPIRGVSLTVEPRHLFAFAGQPLVLRCRVQSGSEPISWAWFWVPDREGSENRTVEESGPDLWLSSEEQSGSYSCRAQNQYAGSTVSLSSNRVTLHIVPNPAPSPLVLLALALGGCAVLGTAALACRRCVWTSSNTQHNLERAAGRGNTEMKSLPSSSKPSGKQELSSDHQQAAGQNSFYCPLSLDRNVETYEHVN